MSPGIECHSAPRCGRRGHGLVAVLALAAATPAGAADVEITAREFRLAPETVSVTVDRNEKVRVRLRNNGELAHNVAIPALDVTTETIQADASTVLEFEAPAPGSYEIVCTVPGHKEAGMRARLHVD